MAIIAQGKRIWNVKLKSKNISDILFRQFTNNIAQNCQTSKVGVTHLSSSRQRLEQIFYVLQIKKYVP